MNDENGTLTNVILRTVFAGMMIVKTLHYLLNNDLFVPGLARFIYTIKLNGMCAGSAVGLYIIIGAITA